MVAARNFIYKRPACLLYHTELLTQTSSQDHPDTNHCVQQALHQRLFRPVCEAGQSQWCNNATVNVVLVHVFSSAGGSSRTAPVIHSLITSWICVQIFCSTALHSSTEPTPRNEQHVRWAPKLWCTFWVKEKSCNPPQKKKIRTQNFLLHKPIPCHYIERSIAVSKRKINGISAVDFCYGSYN